MLSMDLGASFAEHISCNTRKDILVEASQGALPLHNSGHTKRVHLSPQVCPVWGDVCQLPERRGTSWEWTETLSPP